MHEEVKTVISIFNTNYETERLCRIAFIISYLYSIFVKISHMQNTNKIGHCAVK